MPPRDIPGGFGSAHTTMSVTTSHENHPNFDGQHDGTNGNTTNATNNNHADNDANDFFFLSKEAARELPLFQYQGEDRSLLYKYVLSPLATFCVNQLTPVWLAPNSITLIGLMFMIASYLAMWFYVPSLEMPSEEPPRWIYLLNGVAILVYQTLDNMDGKQARRTGNGSPLGLLFDHGCDAVNNIFGSTNWMISMALHPVRDTYLCASVLFGPFALFFVGTWEEYYTGKLIMPIFNGPNEGLLGGALMSFTSWWFGPYVWHGTHAWDAVVSPIASVVLPDAWFPTSGLRNADLLVLFSTYNFIAEPLDKMISVVRIYGNHALLNLLPFATLFICAIVVGSTDLNIWIDMPRTSLHLCVTLFTEMTVDLMMAHMSKQPYRYLRWPLAPLVVMTALVGTGNWSAGRSMTDFLIIYTSVIMTYLAVKTVVTVHEICSLLNIYCFDITTKKPRKTKKV
eukprot:scaffold425_cov175-Amphora_coffeaeformis.AAC.34